MLLGAGYSYTTLFTLYQVTCYVVLALGVPGNVLSAVIWLRRRFVANSSSAVYLAALSIDDLAFLLFGVVQSVCGDSWLCICCSYIQTSAYTLEHLLVLSFTVERLVAILHPLQVCRIMHNAINTTLHNDIKYSNIFYI